MLKPRQNYRVFFLTALLILTVQTSSQNHLFDIASRNPTRNLAKVGAVGPVCGYSNGFGNDLPEQALNQEWPACL